MLNSYKRAEYENRDAVLNVYCGVSEGIVAGVDVLSSNRAEFFLVGRPLKGILLASQSSPAAFGILTCYLLLSIDVAKAEELAGPGELVVSPSVYSLLTGEDASASFVFTNVENEFHKVQWPAAPSVDDIVDHFKDSGTWVDKTSQRPLVEELLESAQLMLGEDGLSVSKSLEEELVKLLEHHRHEASRDGGEFSAELRRVVVMFISVDYEPTLAEDDPRQDEAILGTFQGIFSIIADAVTAQQGQVRQFINDDKGTVCIASFGLRGSASLHLSDRAIEAAMTAQKKLKTLLGIQSSIGITSGKIFCGETGSHRRYEYSLLGPSVNLSARLMAKGSWGEINCDEQAKKQSSGYHFSCTRKERLKGYQDPVPFFTPTVEPETTNDPDDDDVVSFLMQMSRVHETVDFILEKRNGASGKSHPRMLLVEGGDGEGRNSFVTAVLKQPKLAESSVILQANQCFHDDPFYCFTPIITRILLSFPEARERLVHLEKRHKRSAIAPFLANEILKSPPFPRQTGMVPAELTQNLPLINDLIFKGFPFLAPSPDAKKLKDSEKIEKCTELLASLITRYLYLKGMPGILYVADANGMDIYSKNLLKAILRAEGDLLVIGGADDPSNPFDTSSNSCDFVEGLDVERIAIYLLDVTTTFDLFKWILRNDLSEDQFDAVGGVPNVQDKIHQITNGTTPVTAKLARTFASEISERGDKSIAEHLEMFLLDTPSDTEEMICFRVDRLKPEEQMILKIASVAGFDNYSFSQNLLEVVLLTLSRRKDNQTIGESAGVPKSVGGDDVSMPNLVGGFTEESKFDYMFQASQGF